MYLNSRYADGTVPSPPIHDLRNMEQEVPGPDLVLRTWTSSATRNLYYWQDGDRLDTLAEYFGFPRTSWYLILDANPHIEFPTNIKPGTPIWLPYDTTRVK